MSDTEVQRRVNDLKAAGLNPMLGYTSQASTPNVAAARVDNAQAGWEDAGRGVGSAAQMLQQAKAINAQVDNTVADTATKIEQANLVREQARTQAAETSIRQNSAATVGLDNSQRWYNIIETQKNIENLIQQAQNTQDTNTRARLQFPLLQQAQELKNQLDKANIPEAQANAELWKTLESAGKAGEWGADILKSLRAILKR